MTRRRITKAERELTIVQLQALNEWPDTDGVLCEAFDLSRSQLRRLCARVSRHPGQSRTASRPRKARRICYTEINDCDVCGRPTRLREGSRGRRPERHDPCSRFKAYVAAADKELERIEFAEGERGEAARRQIRGDLMRLLNQTPGHWQRPRDERGRFLAVPAERRAA